MVTTQAVFDVEETRGVLVVSPLGDAAGYRDIDIAREVEAVLAKIDKMSPPGVVADLGRANYFGSSMIGAVSAFEVRVRERGGAFAACLVSDDMQQVLRVMKLDTRWPMFDTRKAAVKFVRKRLK
ncbi:MAG: anti-sigma factor antagonist [Planctomycetota bacterium]|nr:MAG: anti-sigma factor antagonist [Planctomycetota bacterium]REJ87464.1 MAG: anti-sigma factor antagonist [Planctomycetota bacterium]REK24432.1 MAG: anti-sigma factor antagonist [Planctomycetota bacterium]REK38621.1 MAG: anti-sigma factor antagonist [Planctomycetota bacterium]